MLIGMPVKRLYDVCAVAVGELDGLALPERVDEVIASHQYQQKQQQHQRRQQQRQLAFSGHLRLFDAAVLLVAMLLSVVPRILSP